MPIRTTDRTPGRLWPLAAFLLAAAMLFASGQPARAEGAKKTGTSLDLMPADAAFYAASLRNREQIDILYKSTAYKTFRSLPLVKMGHEMAMAELGKKGGAIEKYKKFTADKDNQELVEVLTEAVSDDFFIYGGKAWGDFFRLIGKLDTARQLAPVGSPGTELEFAL